MQGLTGLKLLNIMAKIKVFYKSTTLNGKTTFHRSILDVFNFYGCGFKSSQEQKCRNLNQKLRNANYKYQFDFAFVERIFFDTIYISQSEFDKLNILMLSYAPERFDISEYQGNERIILEALANNKEIEVNKYSIVSDSFSFFV